MNNNLKPGTIVKPALIGTLANVPANDWRRDLRGYIVKAEPGQVLVKWDYEAMGSDPLQAYWMIWADIAKA